MRKSVGAQITTRGSPLSRGSQLQCWEARMFESRAKRRLSVERKGVAASLPGKSSEAPISNLRFAVALSELREDRYS